jgi:glucose/arabinose dehydrogenase
MTERSTSLAALGATLALLALAQEGEFDISSQTGPDPVLPEPQRSLWPGMKIAEVIGWAEGQSPAVADGLTITAYATDLANPRTVHTLPNGDVLVVQSRAPEGEPITRPKDWIRGWIMSISHGGGSPQKESNLVTLLRDTDRDGTVDERHDLLTGLDSPFGVAWIDDTLYVADTDAITAYPYKLGETQITDPGTVLTPLPGGPIDHHWTKDLALSPDGRHLYVSVGSNMSQWARTPTSWKTGSRPRRAARRSGRWTAPRAPPTSMPRGCAIPTASPSTPTRASSGAWSTSATSSGRTSFPTT